MAKTLGPLLLGKRGGGMEAEGKVPQLANFLLSMQVHYRPKRVCPIAVSGEGV